MELLEKMKILRLFFVLFFIPFSYVCSAGKKPVRGDMVNNKSDLILNIDLKSADTAEGFILNCVFVNKSGKGMNVYFHPYLLQVLIDSGDGEKELNRLRLLRLMISKDNVIHLEKEGSYTFEFEIKKSEFVWPAPGIYKTRFVHGGGNKKLEDIRLWTGRIESNSIELEFKD